MGFAEATDRVSAYAESLERTIAVDADVIKATQTKLATFGNLTRSVNEAGGAFDRATRAALDMAAAGFGTAETNAVQLGKALEDPIKGISALAKSGVTFTEQEREKIKTLVESNRLFEAQSLVLSAIEKQVGGTAEASASSFDKMKFALAGISDTFGEAFLPVVESMLPVIQRFAEWAGKNTDTLIKLTYAVGITTAAVLALNFAMSINPWVLAVTYTLLATTALFKFSDALKNSESMVGRLIYKLRYLIAPLLAVIDAYNAIARITGLPQLTPDSISLPGIPSAAPTLGPPAAVTGGANRLVPSFPSISGISPSGSSGISPGGSSGGRSGGRSGGMALSDGGGSGPSAASLGLALDLSNFTPPEGFLAGYDPFAGMGFTVNVNGGLATSADIGAAVVDAIKQYTNVSGPADIAVA
jgi:uncharacterized membrane protein YgcG